MNGQTVVWNENTPSGPQSMNSGDDAMRSIKTALRTGLDDEHNWPAAGGSSFGYHRFGATRAFYGTQSQVSSSGTDSRLMMTSDTSRLFAVGSVSTVLLGTPTVLLMGSQTPIAPPQRAHWVAEAQLKVKDEIDTVGTEVTFPNSGFSGIPIVMVSANSTSRNPVGSFRLPLSEAMSVWSLTKTGCYTGALIAASGSYRTDFYFTVISIGSRSL